ncbi:pilus assembly protein [Colwellia sp. TT2012]|uniref:pilus assembly protein n=1 Tax=Colwellia sp. TT2012 TaxID=1720342 RepID=UPI00070D5422|nr:PilC/PilY family type IV pilus protein [Colwellia sp. TT2012]
MNKFLLISLLAISLSGVSNITLSEDIELYVSDKVRQAGKTTKVLIIFDNSGSMGTVSDELPKFDPEEDYLAEGPAHAYNDEATYFNKGGADDSTSIPTSPSDARRFLAEINSCETSKQILATQGFYNGRIREYSFKGNKGTWNEIPENNGLNIEVLDCEDDIYQLVNNVNVGSKENAAGLPKGYPINFKGSKNSPEYHTLDEGPSNVNWSSGGYVTLYSAKYLRYYYGQSVSEVPTSRLESAQNSITAVINSTPSIEFGIEIFNYNKGDGDSDGNGGRIALGITEMTAGNKAKLLDIINNKISADTWTPLCESVYEASQYFAGKPVEFGDDDINVSWDSYQKNKPPMDTNIVTDGSYDSPFTECSSSVSHIILITDGVPTHDFGADAKIEALTSEAPVEGDVCNMGPVSFSGERYTLDGSNSYLPALAGWMSTYDINLNQDGIQRVITHTIGFSEGAVQATALLTETARQGQGKFYIAKNGSQLTHAITGILNQLPPSISSLTSASVAPLDGVKTSDSIYFSLFEPQIGARWQGNLKKYKAKDGEIVGLGSDSNVCNANNTDAPVWDVASWFTDDKITTRTFFMDAGVGPLVSFNRSNLESAFTDATGLAEELGVLGLNDDKGDSIESISIDQQISWAKGIDVDDEDKDGSYVDMRKDAFADPLHSKPVVVNYGGRVYDEDTGTYTGEDDIRIIVGTNAGVLHMFKDEGNTVKENWAFMPKELVHNIKTLRDNYSTAKKVYGIDGEITVHLNDIKGDGKIDDKDTVWLFFGLRRGGDSYYAIDITNPSAPELMWHIDSTSPGFSELGQSWSQPKVGYSRLNASDTTASPVLFIGGGYDTNKDYLGVGTEDSKGRAIYMLDAKTGALLWSLAPTGGTTTFSGTDSIPSTIGLLDSTGDGLVDRLYVGDTGGNVWRVDMPGADKTKFSVFKLASFGSETDNLIDQRFFYEPTIVRTFISETVETTVSDGSGGTTTMTVHQEIPYDAVIIGSGDRVNPLGKDTSDTLYMIKDSYIVSQTFSGSSVPATPTAFTKASFYDYTDNPFSKTTTTQEEEALQLAVSKKSGWYMDLLEDGEKNTSAGLVIKGIVYFTTYTPAVLDNLVGCKPPEGSGNLYAVDLALGVSKQVVKTATRDNDDRVIKINDDWLGSPTLIVLPSTDPNSTQVNSGDIIVGDVIITVGFNLTTSRTYLYRTEQ